MKASFEHTVLEYLDGRLTTRERKKFLNAVAADPEKRGLLEQHEALRTALQDRLHPPAVPLAVQRALAERIPSLTKTLPEGFRVTGEGGRSGRFAGRLFTSTRAGKAWMSLLVATALVSLTLGISQLWKQEGTTASQLPGGATEESSGLSSLMESQELQETASARESRMGRAETVQESVIQHPGSSERISARAIAWQRRSTPHGRLEQTPRSDPSSSMTPQAELVPLQNRDNDRTTEIQPFPLMQLPRPKHMDRFGDPVVLEPRSGFIPFIGPLFFCIESGAAPSSINRSNDNGSGAIGGVYLAALRYEVSPFVTIGLEAGQSGFTRESIRAVQQPLEPGSATSVIIIDRGMVSSMLPWLRLHGQYTLNPESRIQLQLDAGAGVLLDTEKPLVFSLGAASGWKVGPGLMLRAGVHYSGSRMAPARVGVTDPVPSPGVVGIIRRNPTIGYSYSSSIDFRIGIGVRIW